MKLRTIVYALYVVCIVSVRERSAVAHTLDLTTARIALRDNHVDMTVEIDSVQMVRKVASVAAFDSATTIAAASDEELTGWVLAARKAVSEDTHLYANGAAVALTLRAFPTPSEVRFVAAQASAAAHPHVEMSMLRFETTEALPHVRAISASFPSVFGRVLCTFMQPATVLADPGSKASFGVLEAPLVVDGKAPSMLQKLGSTGLAIVAAVLAVVAIALQISMRVREPAATPPPDQRKTL
jgi:hypothetical protein